MREERRILPVLTEDSKQYLIEHEDELYYLANTPFNLLTISNRGELLEQGVIDVGSSVDLDISIESLLVKQREIVSKMELNDLVLIPVPDTGTGYTRCVLGHQYTLEDGTETFSEYTVDTGDVLFTVVEGLQISRNEKTIGRLEVLGFQLKAHFTKPVMTTRVWLW